MRVLFTISAQYLPHHRAGTETNTDQLCKALLCAGHQVAVLAGLSRKSLSGVIHAVRGFFHFTPDDLCGYPVWRSPHGIYDIRRSLPAVLKAFRPDVVVSQLGYAVDFADVAQSHGIPAVVYVHDVGFEWLGLREEDSRCRFLANSNYIAQRLRDDYGISASVLYNIFDKRRYLTGLNGKYVTLVNPHPAKGAELAVNLAEESPDIPFLFIGSTYLGRPTRGLKRRVDAVPNITWLPTTADMRAVYAQTHVLIVPSQVEEGWGRVVTEAQFSGIPILASNRGALPESVGPGGMVLPADDLHGWRRALRAIWHDEQRWAALAEKALQHAARDAIQPETICRHLIAELEGLRAVPIKTYRFSQL